MELRRNEKYTNLFEKWGYEVYLPQREAGLSAQILKNQNMNKLVINKKIFNTDLDGIKNCDILVFFLDGRVPDEGACVELGIAYALGKKCIGYKTDGIWIDEKTIKMQRDVLETMVKEIVGYNNNKIKKQLLILLIYLKKTFCVNLIVVLILQQMK